jgi:4-aminobutyrate aminotransferase-like enzyme
MLGVELPDPLSVSRGLMERGYIALPAGTRAEVLAITPPLTISRAQLMGFLDALAKL